MTIEGNGQLLGGLGSPTPTHESAPEPETDRYSDPWQSVARFANGLVFFICLFLTLVGVLLYCPLLLVFALFEYRLDWIKRIRLT